jgi:hypothetical protein
MGSVLNSCVVAYKIESYSNIFIDCNYKYVRDYYYYYYYYYYN